MFAPFFHPALLQLIRVRTRAKLRRMVQSSLAPRRAFLTLLVVLLGLFWLVSAGASILTRETFELESFRRSISMFLGLYFIWHLIRLAWKRPERMEDWTEPEKFWLLSGPFSGQHLIGYRLAVIFSATLFKASLVSILMSPDIPYFPLGFCGFLTGLIFLEFLRLNAETIAYGLPRKVWLGYRLVVCGILLWFFTMVLLRILSITGQGLTSAHDLRTLVPLFKMELDQLRSTWAGQLLEWPFSSFAMLVTTESLNLLTLGRALLCVGLVCFAGWSAIQLDLLVQRRELRLEQARFRDGSESVAQIREDLSLLRLPRLTRLWGIGPLLWRQSLGVRAHLGGVLMSLVIPAILSLFPLAVPNTPVGTFLSVTTSALFFSFMLLPATLKYDFRRDFDRLSALKMLPVSPTAMVVGQLSAPVLVTFGFHIFVLTVAVLARPVPPAWYLGTLTIMFPIVVFLVALDNLIFLWFPHRLVEEGFEVFLRSIMTFTTKLLLIGVGMGLIVLCEVVAFAVSDAFGIPQRPLFIGGMIALAWSAALFCTALVVRAYRNFDPSVERCK
jgi:hypothetical protein